MTQPVLDIQRLHLSFPGFNGDVHALNNVSLQINRGEIVGLVGESGSGKSVTAMLMRDGRRYPSSPASVYHWFATMRTRTWSTTPAITRHSRDGTKPHPFA